MTATIPRKKLIEVSIPLEAINNESSRRKQKAPKGYPTAIHKYWAQRPVAACRAILFSQLVDDPSAWPDRYPTEQLQDSERRRLHKIIGQMCLWDSSNNLTIMNEARWEIARSIAWNRSEEPPSKNDAKAVDRYLARNAPPVFDPFSGAGSIPLEAQRLGLQANGSDLNPLAVLISKALVEVPPKFAGLPPINPHSRTELERGGKWNANGAEGLAQDIRYYGERLRMRAEEKIGNLYPPENLPDGSPGTVIAWIWARTVRSPDPSAKGASVPLVSSFVLSNKEGKKVWVEVKIDPAAQDGYLFEVQTGALSKSAEEQLKKGTKSGRGTNFVCTLTGAAITPDYVREEGLAGRLGIRLMAIVTEGGRKRAYVSPSRSQEEIAKSAQPGDTSHLEVEMPDNPRWFSPPGYGMRRYVDIFTARQLTALNVCSANVAEVRAEVLRDATVASDFDADANESTITSRTEAYADAIATYLALIIDRMAFYGSSLCGWLAKDNAMGKTMPQQALAMSWDFAEGNPFGKSSSAISTCTKAVADCVHEIQMPTSGTITQIDAASVNYTKGCLISTDPPYYDNVGYADLSDFFYCWLKPTLGDIYPDLFRRLTTPKDLELVATPYRHGGPDAAEQFFMDGMRRVLSQMKTAESEYPIAIYYAFKQQEQSQIGVTSPGWAGFLQAIIDAGFGIDGTWPIRTENPSRSIAQGTNALASSIVLVCRKRRPEASIGTRADFIRALRRELPGAIADIRSAGVGPVDMQQSVIGPGMGVFSGFAKVLEDDDCAMSVRTALSLINRVWEELENELETNFDAETQVALAWFATYGFDARQSGELITLANAKNIGTNALFDSGVFKDLKGKTALTPREELPKGWTPATDKSLTVWECVQHTARVLNAEDGGGAATGRLVAEMGSKAAEARALAYRLFEIATQKGWAAEALIYNELAQEWPKLEDLASSAKSQATTASAQAELF
jgi:putative DNA methylase